AERTARGPAGQAADDRGSDRDCADRLYARPHLEQRLHRHRRGAELYLWADQDDADAVGLALDNGRDRRPRPERPSLRPVWARADRPPPRPDPRGRGDPPRRAGTTSHPFRDGWSRPNESPKCRATSVYPSAFLLQSIGGLLIGFRDAFATAYRSCT